MQTIFNPFARLFADKAEAMTDANNHIYAAPKSWRMQLEQVGRTITISATCDDDGLEDRVLRFSWFPNRDGLYERWIEVDLYRDVVVRMGRWRASNNIGFFELFNLTTEELIETLEFQPSKGQRVLEPIDDDE